MAITPQEAKAHQSSDLYRDNLEREIEHELAAGLQYRFRSNISPQDLAWAQVKWGNLGWVVDDCSIKMPQGPW